MLSDRKFYMDCLSVNGLSLEKCCQEKQQTAVNITHHTVKHLRSKSIQANCLHRIIPRHKDVSINKIIGGNVEEIYQEHFGRYYDHLNDVIASSKKSK
ncbi:unnamed protein product [Acanthoscelides obtectus]|uniref:Uncharacterized protein n=1 Tax=Acanthoscelides obtectus TaxID=200917 RepID=A0A9P0VPV7_ACAOB|nr:unnamed protein product [Acanthoscelides obtectus]CAK1639162.1 hypothetical protein AOBTE_LOCUS11024 [Acanthoscelides obtectus]